MRGLEKVHNNQLNSIHPDKDADRILRYLPRVINQGIPEHFFITGKRGMTKTSFIQYVASIAKKEFNMIPIYINNKGSNTIDDLIINLLEVLFKEFDNTSWGRKIIDTFSSNFQGFNFATFDLTLNEKSQLATIIKSNFREFLNEICNKLDENENGIFFIIDDVDGLSQTPEFPNWYKGLFETIYFYNDFIPAAFSLVANPSNFDEFCEKNPSFPRMFNLITDEDDIKNFSNELINEILKLNIV